MKVDGSKKAALVKELLQKREEERANKADGRDQANTLQGDRVQFGIGRELAAQLSPSKLAEERAEKIERLRKQIQDGSYRVPSHELARAVGEEITMSIMDVIEAKE